MAARQAAGPVEVLVGDVVGFPVKETMQLQGMAAVKAAQILQKMLLLAREIQEAGADDCVSINERLVQLQKELAAWQRRLENLADVFDAVHEKRVELWAAMPEGVPTLIQAEEQSGIRHLKLAARRDFCYVYCTDFEIFERDITGQVYKVGIRA